MKKFLFALMATFISITSFAQVVNTLDNFETVYQDDNVTFRKIDNNTWLGTGNLEPLESLYLIGGTEKAVLIDAGTRIPNLDKIAGQIAGKPVTLLLTHVHPDHAGSVNCFDKVWISAGDTVNIPEYMPDYKGEVNFMENGQLFELGGRTLKAYFTPGHTPGSVTFLEVGTDTGYCGDSFGNGKEGKKGSILVLTNLDSIIDVCRTSYQYFQENGYRKLYCGHFSGNNFVTLDWLQHVESFAKEVKAGKYVIKPVKNFMTLNSEASHAGFTMWFIK